MVRIKQEINSQEQPEDPMPASNHQISKTKVKEEVLSQLPEPIILNDENVREFAKNLRKTAKRQATLLGANTETDSTMFMLELINFLMKKAYPKCQSEEGISDQQPIVETHEPSDPVDSSDLSVAPITQLNSRRRGIAVQKLPKYKKRRLEEIEEIEKNSITEEKPANESPAKQKVSKNSRTEEKIANESPPKQIEIQPAKQLASFTTPAKHSNETIQFSFVPPIPQIHDLPNLINEEVKPVPFSNNRQNSKIPASPAKNRRDDRSRRDENYESSRKNRRERRNDGKRDERSENRHSDNKRPERNSDNRRNRRTNNDDYQNSRKNNDRKSSNYERSSRNSNRRNDYPSDRNNQKSSSSAPINKNSEIVKDKNETSKNISSSASKQTNTVPERLFFPNSWRNTTIPSPNPRNTNIPSSPKSNVVPKRPKIVPTSIKPIKPYPGLRPMVIKRATKIGVPSEPIEVSSIDEESQDEKQTNWPEKEVAFFRNIISRLNANKQVTERQKIIDELRNTNQLLRFLQFKSRYQNQ